ncbi:hypothetical protein ABEF95_007428 [Exophiala dermatitidis]
MKQKTMQQIIPSNFIDKQKLEEFLSTTNDPSSFKVTRKLDKYHVQYFIVNGKPPRELSWEDVAMLKR